MHPVKNAQSDLNLSRAHVSEGARVSRGGSYIYVPYLCKKINV